MSRRFLGVMVSGIFWVVIAYPLDASPRARTVSMAREPSIQLVRFPVELIFKLWQQGRTATRARASTAFSITRSVRLPQAWAETTRSPE